jgi:hypothetical protein
MLMVEFHSTFHMRDSGLDIHMRFQLLRKRNHLQSSLVHPFRLCYVSCLGIKGLLHRAMLS